MFKPTAQQFATPIRVQCRISQDGNGQLDFVFKDADPPSDFCNWKGKGGTETAQGIISDTAEVTMWFRPDIAVNDRLLLNDDESKPYEIKNVENIEQRGMWLLLKVQRMELDFPHLADIIPCIGYGLRAPEFGDPVSIRCRIDRRTDADEATGFFASGTEIKAGDRITCAGTTYKVANVAKDRGIAEVAHVEVKLIGIRV